MHPLEQLLQTPSQAQLVGYLVQAPLRSHSLLELSQRLKMSEKELLVDLGKLVAESWVKLVEKSGQVLYLLNLKHAPAAELRKSVLLGKKAPQDDFLQAVQRLGNIKAAFLSGFLTGQTHLPVDLLLVGEVQPERLHKFLDAALSMFGLELNYTIMRPEEFALRRDTFDRFVRDIFDHTYLTVVDKLV